MIQPSVTTIRVIRVIGVIRVIRAIAVIRIIRDIDQGSLVLPGLLGPISLLG